MQTCRRTLGNVADPFVPVIVIKILKVHLSDFAFLLIVVGFFHRKGLQKCFFAAKMIDLLTLFNWGWKGLHTTY